MSEVHLTINGQPVTAQKGQTILEAAKVAGFDIPTLCHHPAVSNHGACRMCLVEVKGMRTLQTACTCPVAENMEVATDNESINEGRKFSLELLFSERNHYCMFCQMSGDCELQESAYRLGLDHWPYARPFERLVVDASDKYIIMDPNRCILCTRCVRACAEIAANHTLGLRERGTRTMIMADLGDPLGGSSCTECGSCLQVCPTGAIIDARSAYGGHEEDLTHTQTTCVQCSVGCVIDVASRGSRLVRVNGVWDAAPSGGLLCVAGRFEPLYEERARVTQPIVRRNGVQVETSWDEALTLVAQKLKE
ncbi:MAG: 2Fe-2S iron-sulfur cluster binding domain-containing protein, partial [Anaerolineales bacterium]|nr:2Fe-2S iron-sulfur cluster binding domain-containing protein [Anaerolineales bacterium]